MPSEKKEPITFEFVVDSRLARDRDEFRFRVLLDERASVLTERRSPRVGREEHHETEDQPVVDWCRPLEAGTGTAPVSAESGSTTGTICAYGMAMDGSGNRAEEVRGKIVETTTGLGDTPPSDAVSAEMVNQSGQDVFPGVCDDAPNFVFRDSSTGRFLRGVKHSTSGETNKLVVWIRTGNLWDRAATFSFVGVTSSSMDCEGLLSEAPVALATTEGPIAPDGESRKLRLVLGARRGVLDTDVTLSRSTSPPGERVWTSCSKRDPHTAWTLWVETRAGTAYATLALRKLMGTDLPAPLLWRSETWTPGGGNRLVFDAPSDLLGNVPTYVDLQPA